MAKAMRRHMKKVVRRAPARKAPVREERPSPVVEEKDMRRAVPPVVKETRERGF